MPPIGEASGNDDGDSEEMVEVTNPTNSTNNLIQPQQSTVGGSDVAAGQGKLRSTFSTRVLNLLQSFYPSQLIETS